MLNMIDVRLPPTVPGETILMCEVGSTAHGTGTGTDDLDIMGVVIPHKEAVLGLDPWDFLVHRTAAVREGRQDAPSKPGDLDLTLYSLRKFAGLARKGNPSILMTFFAPVRHITPLGQRLRDNVGLFRSKEAGYRFVGYMKAQRERLAGERGQKDVNRPELVAKYGYDTKYAYHIIRLGLQGLEFVNHGKIHMPVLPWIGALLLAIRKGEYPLERVLQWADEVKNDLERAINDSDLPGKAPVEPINRLLVELHEASWAADTQRA